MKETRYNAMLMVAMTMMAGAITRSPGAIVQSSQSSGNSASAFDGAVAVNLIRNGQGSLGTVVAPASALNGTFSAAGLNDGSAAANGNVTYYAVTPGQGTVMPVNLIFNLTAGYNVTNIQVISGWADHNLGEQRFQLLLSVNSGPFTDYGTFTNNASLHTGFGGAGAWFTTLMDSSGTMATNVTGVEFIFLNPDTSNGASSVGTSQTGDGSIGGTVIHELQVFGTYYTNLNVVTTPGLIPVTDSNILRGLTLNNWVCKTNFIGSSVNGAACTVGFQGSQKVALQVDNSQLSGAAASRYPILAWTVNGGPIQSHQLVAGETLVMLSTSVTNPVIDLYVRGMSPFEDRYDGDVPPNSVKITGFVVDPGGWTMPVAQPGKVWLNIGDSIMSGDEALYAAGQGRPSDDTWAASEDGRASYGYLLARHYGFQETRIAYGGYDWAGGLANVPALATLIYQKTSTISRLNGGLLNPVPDVVLVNLGENGAPALSDVTNALVKLRRRVNSGTKIIVMIPVAGTARAQVTQAFGSYTNATHDGNAFLVDLGSITFATGDGQHPTAQGHQTIYQYALPVFDRIIAPSIIQTRQAGGSAAAFDSALAPNLVQAGQKSLASMSVSHGPSISNLFSSAGVNDGSTAANGNLAYFGNTDPSGGNLPVTITFGLNTNVLTGGSVSGYSVDRIQGLTGWSDSDLANQNFQLLFSLNRGPFVSYGAFINTTNTDAVNGGNNAILETLTNSAGGPMVSGVTGVQFIFANPGGVQGGSGGTLIRELQVFGAPTIITNRPARYRITAVGDSITSGFTDNPNWTVPFEFGFRSGLYTRLIDSGMNFQFAGNSPQPWDGTDGIPTNKPTVDLRLLGQDHFEGYGGKGTLFFAGNMAAWLAQDQPDIVLLMAGINDIGTGSTGEPLSAELNLSNMVATVVSKSPNTHLIVAQITPYSSYTAAIVKYNNYIANALVPYFAGQGKLVTTVNQYTNLCVAGTTNIDPNLFANGINHPNGIAYDRMAETWFNGIQALSLPLASATESAANANLVMNGGFEVPSCASNSHNVNPAGSGWVFTSQTAGAGSGIDQGLAYGAGGAASFDGLQRACLQSSGNGSVTHLSQTVNGFAVGQYYQLSFWSEAIGAFAGANPFHVSLISGTNVMPLFGGSDVVPVTGGYTLYTSAPFQADSAVMTLDFADDGLAVATHVSWIDAVGIYPVPGSNLIINGGFEMPDLVNASHSVNPPAPGWTFTAGVSGAGSGIDRGDVYGSSGSIGFEGAQQGFLQSSGNGSVTSVSQVISNFVAGRTYRLSFMAKAIGKYSGANPFRVSVFDGTTTNRLFGGADIVAGTAGYTLYTSEPFQADSTVMTLMLADHGLADVTHVSWIDGVALYALPVSVGAQLNNGGRFQMQFVGDSNLSYTVLGTTNLALPYTAWDVLGPAVNAGGNTFAFTEAMTNGPQRFYQVRLP